MSTPDGVLDAIDAAVRDYSVSPDAMRWEPDEPDPTPALAVPLTVDLSAFTAMMTRAAEAVGSVGKALSPLLDGARAAFHVVAYQGDRKHRRRCPTCNPAGFPKPLSINGHEYNRRRRRRRNRS